MEITSLLNMMKEKKASDLFITVGLPPSMKVDGRIAPISQNALTPAEAEEIVLNMMTPAQRDEFEATRECQFAVSETGVGRFRASAFYQRNHPGVILRRIETYIPSIEELKLPPIIKNLSMTKRGLIIFIGATGTGKSTSLASMIDYRNRNGSGHIVTIEDPHVIPAHCPKRRVSVARDADVALLENTSNQVRVSLFVTSNHFPGPVG